MAAFVILAIALFVLAMTITATILDFLSNLMRKIESKRIPKPQTRWYVG